MPPGTGGEKSVILGIYVPQDLQRSAHLSRKGDDPLGRVWRFRYMMM